MGRTTNEDDTTPLLEESGEPAESLAPPGAPASGNLEIHCGTCKADITGHCYIAIVPGPQGNQPLIFQPGRCPLCQAYTVQQVAAPQIARPTLKILRPS